jgi:HK97 family phage prohead protease
MSALQSKLDDINKSLALIGMEFEVARLEAAYRRKFGPTDDVVGVLDFSLTGRKSVSQETTADGRLRFEGLAAGYDEDRDEEAFLPGAFEKGVREWIRRGGILLWNHSFGKPMGVVTDANITPHGLVIKGVLDDPEPGTELADIHRKVASGTVRGLSIGGKFKRRMTPAGVRIYEADIIECSLCAAPVQPDSLFTLSGKGVGSTETAPARVELVAELMASLDRFSVTVGKLGKP